MANETTSIVNTDSAAVPTDRNPRKKEIQWFIAFLLFPYGPFIYMTWLGALKWYSTIVLLLACLVVHAGMLSVLIKTNSHPWQPWLVMLISLAMYSLGLFQFVIGMEHRLWSKAGRRAWKICGWIFGLFLLAGLSAMIVQFHLIDRLLTAD